MLRQRLAGSLAASLPRRARVALAVLAATAVLAALASVLHTCLGLGQGTHDSLFESWFPAVSILASAALCLGRSVLVEDDRMAWRALGTGVLVWGLAGVYYSIVLKGAADPPYPSLADPMYLALYPALYVAIVVLLRSRVERFHTSLWLDGLIATLGATSLAAALLYEPVLSATLTGNSAEVITNLAYPVGDLLLIFFVVGVFTIYAGRPGRDWWLLLGGLVVLTMSDTAYMLTLQDGTYVDGAILDSGWPVSMVMVAAAAWQRPGKTRVKLEGGKALAVPLTFAIGALALIVYGNAGRISPFALVLATLTLVAAGARALLTFREVQGLANSRREARTDELTGLANRRQLLEHLDATLSRARDGDSTCALVIIDLDHFKELNDTLGHGAGDLLLKRVGDRLSGALRGTADLVARLGGDEFAIVLEPGSTKESAMALTVRVRAAMEQSVEIRGISFHVEASAGVAVYPEHGEDGPTLMRRADVAMYSAKALRSGVEIYRPESDSHSLDRLGLLGDLRRALDDDELVVHYQPLADPDDGTIIGAEALVRWQHPTRGLLGPHYFLPLAEQTGLMRPLTMYVLRAALRQCREWRDAGLELSVSVNLAMPNLVDSQLPGLVEGMLAEERIEPAWLCLELTESSVMADPDRALEILGRLNRLGVRLSVDDFGTGYSSLAYLKRLPVHEVKVDRSFVMCMEESPADAAIVRSTVSLAHELGLEVVGEGVETAHALASLADMGCDRYQGFFLSRPVPAEDLTRWLESRLPATRPARV
jgi:diguanylate cyclase (GGDEF)-like protein